MADHAPERLQRHLEADAVRYHDDQTQPAVGDRRPAGRAWAGGGGGGVSGGGEGYTAASDTGHRRRWSGRRV